MSKLPFTKKNYQLMVIGILTIILGFTFMALDSEPYGFGFMGITLAPIVVVAGFALEIVAILYTPKEKK
ncbi:MAG TPA: DUF3098 domain-containing protein [Cyclobacteriaceae bacterium]|nr:DUF3098 domain-containing protein [Cyclobacteriaceae bacterium]HNP08564.1 DUF3098 domain-containing protein [Cyclobacteriaceae bacterium]